ncbi:MAG TPA: amino acid adenylation domain-containing protein [Ktedonobacteraceae bacterium]|nr:amino acid adenylation domain-containing protein [Ktedonobacteraceae bacterium]
MDNIIPQQSTSLSAEQEELMLLLLEEVGMNVAKEQTIQRRMPGTDASLSFAQQRLWFLDQLLPENPAYNNPLLIHFQGSLQVDILFRSLKEIIRRHEALRTIFITVDGQPMQHVLPVLRLPLSVVDLQVLSSNEQEALILDLATAEAQCPFHLTRGPLVRFFLLRVKEDKHALVFNIHHIISDGWSIDLFLKELNLLYDVYLRGVPSPLPELAVQYADVANWQRQWLHGKQLETQLIFWKEHLQGVPPVSQLPADRPRSVVQTFRGAKYAFEFSQELADTLRQVSLREDCTLFMTLLAVFYALLYRYNGQKDLVVGSPIANRTHSEVEDLIGFFVNTLALRATLSGDMPFRTLLKQVRETTLSAYTHQDLPFQLLVEALQPERNPGHSLIFQIVFALHNTFAPVSWEATGLRVFTQEVESGTVRFDLTLNIRDTGKELQGTCEYNTDLFDKVTISRLIGHYRTLLEGIVATPDERVSHLPLLTEQERQHLLVDCNATEWDFPHNVCVHTLFEQQVACTPDVVALVAGEEQITYEELNRRANQLAHHLRSQGVGPEVRVGLFLPRTPLLLLGLLATLKAGGAYVPLDPNYPSQRLAFMCADSQPALLLSCSDMPPIFLPALDYPLLCLDTIMPTLVSFSPHNLRIPQSPASLAYLIYTSGSTGLPKGVLLSHQGLCNLATAQRQHFSLRPSDRLLQFASLSFDASIWEICLALLSGATLILSPIDLPLIGPTLHQVLRSNAISAVTLPPSTLAFLPEEPLPELHTLIVAGEACPAMLAKRWGPGRRFFNAYGPTELTVCATIALCHLQEDLLPIGHPIANTQVYVLDELMQPVPIGCVGELYLGGMGIARGYHQRPDQTAERFVPHPFSSIPGERLYKTGDLARYRFDGAIEFLGRRDHQIKIRGFRIELEEVEAVLKQHSAVQEALVLAREDGPGEKRLVAYIVATEHQLLSRKVLFDFLQIKLPGYMIPAAFVLLPSMPLTSNGKIDRGALPPPGVADFSFQTTFLVPGDMLELQLVHIWEELLCVHPIGVSDNFFMLGGHSFLAIHMMDRIRQQFGYNLPISTLFQGPTIAQLAALLRQQEDMRLRPILVPIQPRGSMRPLFFIHPISGGVFVYYHLARYLGQEQPLYGLQDPGIFEEAISYISIETMAARYVSEIRKVQSEGPYLLGGWSFGGILAFEMAQQLRQQGQDISFLAIIDSVVPDHSQHSGHIDDVTFLAVIAVELTRTLDGKDLEEITNDLQRLEPKERIYYVLDRIKRSKRDLPANGFSWLQQQLQIFKIRMQAIQNYHFHTYTGNITLFRASERDSLVSPLNRPDFSWDLGWSRLTTRSIEAYAVPGYHETMIVEPHVQVLAKHLHSCLERVHE